MLGLAVRPTEKGGGSPRAEPPEARMDDPFPPDTDLDDDEDLEAALRAAEEAVNELAASFTTWLAEDLGRASEALGRAKTAPGANAAEIEEVFGICHNIKGQAGSFGYDLMTRIAGMLCDYIRDAGDLAHPPLGVVEGHLMALQFILDHQIEGDGGEVGEKLVAKLSNLTSGQS